jgi:cytolysin-activating lysine-acyltransferase
MTQASQQKPNEEVKAIAPTVSHMLGEMTWLLTQSPLHKHLKLADLEWLVMPALLLQQYYIFRDGDKPVGLALWAYLDETTAKKLDKPLLETENRLTAGDWKSGDHIWLIDLVAPFANAENKHIEIMMADLIMGPMKGKEFNLHRTDPKTGARTKVKVEKDTSEKLGQVIKTAAGAATGEAGKKH